jgi:hypothetical protein
VLILVHIEGNPESAGNDNNEVDDDDKLDLHMFNNDCKKDTFVSSYLRKLYYTEK